MTMGVGGDRRWKFLSGLFGRESATGSEHRGKGEQGAGIHSAGGSYARAAVFVGSDRPSADTHGDASLVAASTTHVQPKGKNKKKRGVEKDPWGGSNVVSGEDMHATALYAKALRRENGEYDFQEDNTGRYSIGNRLENEGDGQEDEQWEGPVEQLQNIQGKKISRGRTA